MAFKLRSQRRSKLDKARYGSWVAWTFILPPFGYMILCVIWPAIYLGYLSLSKWDGLGDLQFIGLKNFERILTDDRFWLAIKHNLTWSVGALTVPPILGLALAVLLTRKGVIGQRFFQVIFFLPQTISSVIMAVIWRWIYYPRGGPANSILAALGFENLQPQWLADSNLAMLALFIAYCWVANGFSMLIFQAAIQSIDISLFEAARIDGASWWAEVRHILLPGIRQALVTVLIVTAIWSFQIFDLVYLTTRGGPGDATYVLAIAIYTNTWVSARVGMGAAIAMILLVIVIGLSTILISRQKSEEAW